VRWGSLLVLATLAGAGCSDAIQADSVDVPIGESRQALGVTIQFVRLVSDNRCPQEAECTIAGAVAVHVELRSAGESVTRELWTMRDRNEVTISGRRVTLVDVLPHPSIFVPTDPAAYVARLSVEHRTR
jgi:hypothetical protein